VIFAHLSKVFIVVYRFNCMNSFNLYKKTYDVIPCVCPLIDHGSRPMKSHEFLRLLYNIYFRIIIDNRPIGIVEMKRATTMNNI
jgi:hypothetical protein